jgi:hypothetical protein
MSTPPPDPFPRMVALIVVVMLVVTGVLVWALINDGAFDGDVPAAIVAAEATQASM